ncbi:hypothetical protein MLD38_014643 [Melastoma candidum]|uniref:Uncharacterized protein n=1 Tax=Melastoma candidum TaxID=119954 RepID=A0ACB9RLX2_9MYRT|nr:hypothetical protein MLD38_014643 [Melastoma candidum]
MGVRNWSDLQRREAKAIYLGRDNSQTHSQASLDKLLQNWRWHGFWRRWRLGKKGVLEGSYDASDYFQNFDDGMGFAEPDNFSRSFSARYAGQPLRDRKEKLLIDL